MPNRTLPQNIHFQLQYPRKTPQDPWTPNWVVSTRFQANQVLAVGDDSGHHPCIRAVQGGGARRVNFAGQISLPTAAERALIRPTNAAAIVTVGRRFSSFFGHSRPTHTSLPSFLDPLNSFSWSFSSDSSPFERYDENKFGRWLDRVFRPPQQLLDQGKGTAEFMVSWAFR